MERRSPLHVQGSKNPPEACIARRLLRPFRYTKPDSRVSVGTEPQRRGLPGVSYSSATGIMAGSPRVTPLVKNRSKPTCACLVERRSEGSCHGSTDEQYVVVCS